MKRTMATCAGIASLLANLLAPGAAFAGTPHTATCYNTGLNAAEPIGDRQGHTVQVSAGTCRESGGEFDGLITTQSAIWEHDPSGSKMLSGDGVARKPGSLVAYRLLEATMQAVMQDGKPVGWIAKGRGLYTIGTGDLSKFSGKTFSWTAKPAGPRMYTIETISDD